MRHITTMLILTGALALSGAALARDLTLPKTSADELKTTCEKAGGKFSQEARGYGCGTDCKGGPGHRLHRLLPERGEMHRASDRRPPPA